MYAFIFTKLHYFKMTKRLTTPIHRAQSRRNYLSLKLTRIQYVMISKQGPRRGSVILHDSPSLILLHIFHRIGFTNCACSDEKARCMQNKGLMTAWWRQKTDEANRNKKSNETNHSHYPLPEKWKTRNSECQSLGNMQIHFINRHYMADFE